MSVQGQRAGRHSCKDSITFEDTHSQCVCKASQPCAVPQTRWAGRGRRRKGEEEEGEGRGRGRRRKGRRRKGKEEEGVGTTQSGLLLTKVFALTLSYPRVKLSKFFVKKRKFFLCGFHTRCLTMFSVPWYKKSQNWSKLKSRHKLPKDRCCWRYHKEELVFWWGWSGDPANALDSRLRGD